jgi:hypothetical protein
MGSRFGVNLGGSIGWTNRGWQLIHLKFIEDFNLPTQIYTYRQKPPHYLEDYVNDMVWLENASHFLAVLQHNWKVQVVKFKTSDASEIFRFELKVLQIPSPGTVNSAITVKNFTCCQDVVFVAV